MVSAVFPSFASSSRCNLDSAEIHQDGEFRWASGKKEQYPGWNWINGYCYYLTNMGGDKLTNCMTPDGYAVDEEGRWTVDGVPQHNGYGNLVVGTDELYAGKSDDERWQIIHDKLEKLYAEKIPGNEMFYAMSSGEGFVWGTVGALNPGKSIIHNVQMDRNYDIYSTFTNIWNDSPEVYTDYRSELMETTIRLICGDHIGQELFEDLRKAAEPTGGPAEVPVYDENGDWIMIGDGRIQMKTIESSNDGINFALFDLNKWNGRKTDYGKTIEIEPSASIEETWSLKIY